MEAFHDDCHNDPFVRMAATEIADHFVADPNFIMDPTAFDGVESAVFGCGNRDRAATYPRIPKFIDEPMASRDARRLPSLCESDASGTRFF